MMTQENQKDVTPTYVWMAMKGVLDFIKDEDSEEFISEVYNILAIMRVSL